MNTKNIRKAVILLIWLVLWQLASVVVDNSLIFVGPLEVVRALCTLIPTSVFWQTVGISLCKIGIGLLAGFVMGMILGALAYRFSLFREMIAPLISLMKTVPVASFVILALIFMGSENLCLLIVFIIVIPVVYNNTYAGFHSTSKEMLEMARIFRITGWKKFRYIYQPALFPFLLSASKVAVGMSWKSGVAAEVIGLPTNSIGENLYMSKIYLETADLFAWTFVIIVVSALFEKLFLKCLSSFQRKGGTSHETEHL